MARVRFGKSSGESVHLAGGDAELRKIARDLLHRGKSDTMPQAIARAAEENPELAREHTVAKRAKQRSTPARKRRPAAVDPPDPGAFLKHKREEQGRSQRQVAKAAGIPAQTLSDVEHGAQPTWPTFSRVARELGVTAAEVEQAGLW